LNNEHVFCAKFVAFMPIFFPIIMTVVSHKMLPKVYISSKQRLTSFWPERRLTFFTQDIGKCIIF